jgi:Flp pilus assembly pilin Flp
MSREPGMRRFINKLWTEDDGVLSFEWTLLIVLVVIGIISGLGAARDVIIDELGDTAEAVLQFDQSYSFVGLETPPNDFGIPGSEYIDDLGTVTDCARSTLIPVVPRTDGT